MRLAYYFFWLSSAVLFFVLLPNSVFGAVSYSRSPGGFDIASPVTVSLSFGDFISDVCTSVYPAPSNFYRIRIEDATGEAFLSQNYHNSATNPGTFTIFLPNDSYVVVQTECSVDAISWSSGEYLEILDGISPIFNVIAGVSAGGLRVYTPSLKLLSPLTGKIISGAISIDYAASDEDDVLGQEGHGLSQKPVNFYYAPPRSFDWFPIAKDKPATGTVLWDTTKLPDGSNYRFKGTVSGADNDFNQTILDEITLDNTPPNFRVQTTPTFTKGEPVEIEIESSEILKSVPTSAVTQFNHEPVPVSLSGDVLEKKFKAVYHVIPGFDGPATISLNAEDAAGNKSSIILGNERFAVGIKPPPPPKIETTAPILAGIGINAHKVIAKVNGTRQYVQENLKDGRFRIENVTLDPDFNKGRNTISVVSFDANGAISEPAIAEVFINSPPKLTLLEPRSRLSTLNGAIRFHWEASDVNEDPLTYRIELSDNRGRTWKVLAQDLKVSEFVWDSTAVPDGSSYLLRVSASDGSITASVLTGRVSILNDLPAIVLETSGDFFTAESSKTFKGVVRSKKDLLTKLEFSFDDGKTWTEILPEDRSWDSTFERFSFLLPILKAGSHSIILRGFSRSGKVVINAQSLKITFDSQAPTLITSIVPKSPINKNVFSLNGLAYDNVSGIESVEYTIDDSKWYQGLITNGFRSKEAEFKINHPDSLPDGRHEIKIRSVDRAGNASAIKNAVLLIDTTPPRIGSFVLKIQDKIIFPGEGGIFKVVAQTPISFKLAIAGKPKRVSLFANEKSLEIKFDSLNKLWVSNLVFKGGERVMLKVGAEDELGNKVEKELATLSIL